MSLNSISPIDGRYSEKTSALSPYFSEFALMKYRVIIEGEYFIALSLLGKTNLKKLSRTEIEKIRNLYKLREKDYEHIKNIEKTTNHDVKAVEYFLKEKLSTTSLKNVLEWIHFGMTSYDINTPARGMMLSDALTQVIIPKIILIIQTIEKISIKYKDLPMLSRTHGQSASPTTFGKEMKVFVNRLEKILTGLRNIKIEAKLNGATGNYNAHIAAYPKINWVKFSQDYINSLNKLNLKPRIFKLEPNLITTQIECHDSYVAV